MDKKTVVKKKVLPKIPKDNALKVTRNVTNPKLKKTGTKLISLKIIKLSIKYKGIYTGIIDGDMVKGEIVGNTPEEIRYRIKQLFK